MQSNFDRDQALLEDSLRRVAAEEDFQRELMRDSLLRAGGRINYAITVVSTANSSTRSGRGEIASGATVTVQQHGTPITVTTDASGQAVFEDMRVGNAAVTVTAADHTSATMIVDLTPVEATEGDATIDYSKITRNAATLVPLFPTAGSGTGTILGNVLGETDLTNETQEQIDGYAVTAYIDVDNLDNDYFAPSGSMNEDAAGRIIQITYTDVAQTVTSDASGSYSLTVPGDGGSGLPVDIQVSDYVADITYYVVANSGGTAVVESQTVSHVYGPSTSATDIEQVPGAFVRIDAPTGAEEMGSGASADAIVEDEGVLIGLILEDVGRGFTQAPDVEITGEGYGATGTVTITNGRITDATLTAGGQDYDPGSTDVDLVFNGKDADITPNVEYSLQDMMGMGWSLDADVNYGSVTGAANFNDILINAGSGYNTQPTGVTIGNATGTGAAATAVALLEVTGVEVATVGKGYTNTPFATFAGGTDFDDENPVPAVAAVELGYGPVLDNITVASYAWGEGPFSNDKTATPTVDIDDVNGNNFNVNNAAAFDVTWATTGVLPEGTLLQINNGGSGYIDGNVTLTFSGAGASTETVEYKVATNGDAITQVEILNTTSGWDQDLTITVAVAGAGTGGDIQLAANTIEYPVASITVTNGGSYQFNNLTQDEIDEFQDGNNPYGGGVLDNDMRLYVNSTTDDFLYTTDLEFNRCVETMVLYVNGEYMELPTSLTIDAPTGSTTAGATAATATYETDGSIVDIIITAGGSGYTPEETTMTIVGGGATDDVAEVDLTPFESNLNSWEEFSMTPLLVGFTVEDGGAGYVNNPNVRVTVPGAAGQSYAIATATTDGDAITSVDFVAGITSLEYNYSDLGDIDATGIDIDVMIWKENGTLSAIFATGSVVAVNVTDGGEGYDAANPPTVRFVTGGGDTGDGATGTAVVIDGRVVRIDVTDGGSGYDPANPPSVEFVEPDDAPVTAAAVALIDEKTGAITGVQLRDPSDDCFDAGYYSSGFGSPGTSGEGYIVEPAAVVEASVAGMGSGAVLEVEINDQGEVTAINVVDGGSGYFGRNYSQNFSATPGNDVSVSWYDIDHQSNVNVISGKTHVRNIIIGTGSSVDGN